MNGIMKECLVAWELNDIPQPPILCTGEDIDALLIGHAITSGLAGPEDGLKAALCGEDLWMVSSKGSVNDVVGIPECLDRLLPNPSGRRIERPALMGLCEELMAQEHDAGLHAVLLSDGERCVGGWDIGRHNAFDKAVGKAVMKNIDLPRTVLCTTARLTLETLVRAARTGIPILATRKPVGSLCIENAEKLDIAVCRIGEETICCSAAWRVI